VLADPAGYGLFTSNSIMELNLGGVMIERQGDTVQLALQIQSTTNLATPFTNHGPPLKFPNSSFCIQHSALRAPPTPPPHHQPRDNNSTFGKKSNCHSSSITPRRAYTLGVFYFCRCPFPAAFCQITPAH